MHRVLCGKTLGLKFWEKARKGREEHYGELPWPAISKNIRAGDLREDDREISKHEHSFKDCVSAAFKHAEHKNSLLQKDYDRALEHCQKNLSRKAGDRGDEHPCFVDVQVAKEAIEKLEDLKRSEHRMDNRLSREEWTDCFMEVRRGVGRLTPSTRCLCATAWRSNHHPRPRLMNTSRIDGVKAQQRHGTRSHPNRTHAGLAGEGDAAPIVVGPEAPQEEEATSYEGSSTTRSEKRRVGAAASSPLPSYQTSIGVGHAAREQASKIGLEDAPAR